MSGLLKLNFLFIPDNVLAVDDYCIVFCIGESYNAQWLRNLERIEKHR